MRYRSVRDTSVSLQGLPRASIIFFAVTYDLRLLLSEGAEVKGYAVNLALSCSSVHEGRSTA